jgi:hypothetical protein
MSKHHKALPQHRARGSHSSEAVAHHEAGHAVTAIVLRTPIKSVTIVPAPGALGQLKHRPIHWGGRDGEFNSTPHGIDRAERHIMVSMAGPLASRKFLPGSHWRRTGNSDFDSVRVLFTHIISGPDPEYLRLYFGKLWRQAELLIDDNWKEIRAVAAELLKRGTLDKDAVRDAIDRARGIEPIPREQLAAAFANCRVPARPGKLTLPEQPRAGTVMPNGKMFIDCTKEELIEYARRLKGWSEVLRRRAKDVAAKPGASSPDSTRASRSVRSSRTSFRKV